jgi:hypothetical protein
MCPLPPEGALCRAPLAQTLVAPPRGRGAPGPASVPSCRPGPTSCDVSELSTYLDSDSLNQYDESFSVLNWWQDHKRTYHILFVLVKDIMTILVSTISFESAFSLSGRLLDDRRRSLTPAHIERLSLIKDWEQDDARQQHNTENKELEEMIENLFLDDGPTVDVAGSSVGSFLVQFCTFW